MRPRRPSASSAPVETLQLLERRLRRALLLHVRIDVLLWRANAESGRHRAVHARAARTMNEACGIFSVPSVASPIAQPSPAFGARRGVRRGAAPLARNPRARGGPTAG